MFILLYLFFLLSAALAQDPINDQLDITTSPTNAEVCGVLLIQWTQPGFNSAPDDTELTIVLHSEDGTTNKPLTSTALLGDGSFTYQQVAVEAGQYTVNIIDTAGNAGVGGLSNPFVIRATQGGSSDCLSSSSTNPTSSSSESSSSSSITSGEPSQTQPQSQSQSNTGSATSAPASETADPTNTGIPAVSSSGISTGAKAGLGVAGAIILLCGFAGLYWFFAARRRYRSPNDRHRHADAGFGGGAYGGGKARWTGLNSVDEYGSRFTNTAASKEAKGVVDPLGRSFAAPSPTGVSTTTNLEKRSEEVSYPPQDQPGSAYLPPVSMFYADTPRSPIRMTRSQSGSSSRSAPYRQRTDSQQDFPETPASDSLSSLGNTVAVPITSSADPIRRSKGPVSRKPVPNYPEDVDETGESPTTSSFIDPFRSRPASTTSFGGPTSSDPHGTSPLSESLSHDQISHLQAPELQHKGSFGEIKPMQHVLVPDMPAPQRTPGPPIRMS